MLGRSRLLPAVLACLVAQSNSADDFKILPGERLGGAVLGERQRQLRAAMGQPDTTTRLAGGLIREDWLGKRLAPKAYVEMGLFFRHDFVTVYFRHGRAIQVEASSPDFKTPDGLTRASNGLKFRLRYRDFKTIQPPPFHNPDPGGCPAPKHFVAYDDAMSQGIAWRYGAWGGLAPDPDVEQLEMVIVHRRGEPVIVDPDGGIRLVWKTPPHLLLENYPKG